MKKFLGTNEILDSGTIISIQDLPIIFELTSDMEANIDFKVLSSNEKHGVAWRPAPNGRTLNITISYTDTETELGIPELVGVGDINGQIIYFTFWLTVIPGVKPVRILNYTWLLAGSANK
jgi:hypothetical protein